MAARALRGIQINAKLVLTRRAMEQERGRGDESDAAHQQDKDEHKSDQHCAIIVSLLSFIGERKTAQRLAR